MTSSIVIADDHPLYRAALVQTIQSFSDTFGPLECTACSSLTEAHHCIEAGNVKPNLVLLDLHMPLNSIRKCNFWERGQLL